MFDINEEVACKKILRYTNKDLRIDLGRHLDKVQINFVVTPCILIH